MTPTVSLHLLSVAGISLGILLFAAVLLLVGAVRAKRETDRQLKRGGPPKTADALPVGAKPTHVPDHE